MKTQLDIENENLQIMITKGINELQNAKTQGNVSDLKISGAIIPHYVGELANGLDTYTNIVMSGMAKIKALPAKMLTILDSRVVAHYTVKAVIDSVGTRKVNIVSIGKSLASYLETEYKVQLLEQKDPKKKEQFVGFIQSTNYLNKRQAQITNDLLKKYHKDIATTSLSFYKLAVKSLVLLASTKPIVNNNIMPTLCYIEEKLGVESSLYVASWFKDWLSEMLTKNDGQVLAEYHTPLIEKPIDWEGMHGGGFHSPRFKYPLIKTEVPISEYKDISPRTLSAINRLQSTPWKVNKKILEVMLHASEYDLGWGGLPTTYTAKNYLTSCPHTDIHKDFMTKEQKEERKMWRAQSAPHYLEQESRASKVLSLKRVLIEANRFKENDKLYFAYFLDFRGRIYPKASNLQPQGTDFVKALLMFHDGHPIVTKDAEKYFYMQGANSFGHGLDKKTLEEKKQWVISNKERIVESANNPYDTNGFWLTADEDPWLFLAFCFELKEYLSNPNFRSHLPIAFDGSCNGLQHLSAMLLDDIGGEAVNLTNKESKQDIYDVVRGKTETLLRGNSDPLAGQLLKFGITRKACKRPVMIVPYAGTLRACRKYIEEQIIKEGAQNFFKDNFKEALSLYTSSVWEAIGLTIVKGRDIMSFLGKYAKKIIIEGNMKSTISWRTPNGFEVHQKRLEVKQVNIKTPLGNTIKSKGYIRNMVAVYTDKTAIGKHATAIAPNLVHSFDSCHLQETVNSMPKDTSFAMIHDSFGTHASHAAELSKNLREVFYNMYKNGKALDVFIEEQGVDLGDLELPSKGNLDLSLVLKDQFFFS